MDNEVIRTSEFVANHAKCVTIDAKSIGRFAGDFEPNVPTLWLTLAPYNLLELTRDDQLDFLLVLDAINFSYWGDPKWTIDYDHRQYDGTWAVIACMGRAISQGIPLLDAKYRARMELDAFAEVFSGEPRIPLLSDRWAITKEVAAELVRGFGGLFRGVIEAAGHDAQKLLRIIVDSFRSFEDSATYENQEVFFYKRAQLLVADVHQLLLQRGERGLGNISTITAFADYKVPQVLRKHGILKYSASLSTKVDSGVELRRGSAEETEIRGSTIWAVELIRQELQKRRQSVSTIDIDHHLWLLSQQRGDSDKPYHRTRTTAY